MPRLWGCVLGLMGSLVLLVAGWLAVQRQAPSTAYWLLTRVSTNAALYHDLLDPHGNLYQRLHLAQANQTAIFVAWTPDSRHLFYHHAGTAGHPGGLYVLDRFTGQQWPLLFAAQRWEFIYMNASPDRQWYAFRAVNSENAFRQSKIALIAADGRTVRHLLPHFERPAQFMNLWSPDSRWVYYRAAAADGQPLFYRVGIAGQGIQRLPGPPYSHISAPEGEGYLYQDEATARWAAYQPRSDQSIPLGEYTPFWSGHGRFVYLPTGGDGNQLRLERIDLQTRRRQVVIPAFEPTVRAVAFAPQPGDPEGLIWARAADWLIWQRREGGRHHIYQTRPDGSQTRLLFVLPYGANDVFLYEAPTGQALLVTYVEATAAHPFTRRIIHIDLATRATITFPTTQHQLVSLSGPLDAPLHGPVLSVLGGGLLVLGGILLFRVTLQQRPTEEGNQ